MRLVLHDTWRVTQAVDYTYLQDMLHTVVDFTLFHNHPHVQCRLLRKQKLLLQKCTRDHVYCLVCCQDCTRYCVSTLLLASIATLWQLQWIKGYYNYRELIIKFSSRNRRRLNFRHRQYVLVNIKLAPYFLSLDSSSPFLRISGKCGFIYFIVRTWHVTSTSTVNCTRVARYFTVLDTRVVHFNVYCTWGTCVVHF